MHTVPKHFQSHGSLLWFFKGKIAASGKLLGDNSVSIRPLPPRHPGPKGDLMSKTNLQSPARKHPMLTLEIDAWLDLEDPRKGSWVQRMNELLQGRCHGLQQGSMWVGHVKTGEELSRQQHLQPAACCNQESRGALWRREEQHREALLLPPLPRRFLPGLQLEWSEAGGCRAGGPTTKLGYLYPPRVCTRLGEVRGVLRVLGFGGGRGICHKTPSRWWWLLTRWKEGTEYQPCLKWGKTCHVWVVFEFFVCFFFLRAWQNSLVFVLSKPRNSLWRK